ncbi:hypothetical protein QJS04_geneDACA003996 [Acorus gramineus]|uniref:SET domain-containing protein n=1 Tax=Acorus gramineus TaxID=55184 RepID=A0AAV9BG41_ACOGR|nr:hypothetical protein QJS04_geneDACA003996 [Acorus gramineus]
MEVTNDFVVLCLPPPSEDDLLFTEKKNLLSRKTIDLNFRVRVSLTHEEATHILDLIVQAARILHLNEIELYFIGDHESGMLNPRNELESLNLILFVINSLLPGAQADEVGVLLMLQAETINMIKCVGAKCDGGIITEEGNSDAEDRLLQWGQDHGVKTKLQLAHFEGAGRGAVASEDVVIGETVLEIPESLLICDNDVYKSDMFDIMEMSGINDETMLLLWSMREISNPKSKFKAYFEALPTEFNTGLSFGIIALTNLEGTLLVEEILQAKEHLRNEYEALQCKLLSNHPEVFEKELYTWECYLWACELWYSNSMKVVFSDGKLKTCLVPIAGFLNHSLVPHILNYGRVDSATKSLKLRVSRPCMRGEQCYLSYGNFSSSHLVTFYGFFLKGDNFYDVIPLDFDTPQTGCGDWSTHMVQGTWLSRSKDPHSYGLPDPLLSYLRTTLKDDDVGSSTQIPGHTDLTTETERAVLEMIISIFDPMMKNLDMPDDDDGSENPSWDVTLAMDFKARQKIIISSVLQSCYGGLQLLDGIESSNAS